MNHKYHYVACKTRFGCGEFDSIYSFYRPDTVENTKLCITRCLQYICDHPEYSKLHNKLVTKYVNDDTIINIGYQTIVAVNNNKVLVSLGIAIGSSEEEALKKANQAYLKGMLIYS